MKLYNCMRVGVPLYGVRGSVGILNHVSVHHSTCL